MSATSWRLTTSVLFALSILAAAAGILSVDGPVAGNDKSRWLTVRALAETGSVVIGHRGKTQSGIPFDEGLVSERGWRSEDVVLNPDTHAFTSSKPPLLSVAVFALAKPLMALTGLTLRDDAATLVPALLSVVNGVAFLLLLVTLLGLAKDAGACERSRAFLLVAAVLGTPLLAYARVLTNHVPAMACAAIVAWALHRILALQERRAFLFLMAGAAAGGTFALELPAGVLVVVTALLLRRADPRRTLLVFLPAALLPVAAFFATNVVTLGHWLPPYFRDATWYRFDGSYWQGPNVVDLGERRPFAYAFHFLVGHHGALLLSPVLLLGWAAAWLGYSSAPDDDGRALVRRRTAVAAAVIVLLLILLGKGTTAPRLALAGLLVVVAAGFALWRRSSDEDGGQVLARLAFSVSVPVVAFYVGDTKNYGGTTLWPRWILWLVPLWLGALAPFLPRVLEHKRARVLALVLLLLSALSTLAAGFDPWLHPWPFRGYAEGAAL